MADKMANPLKPFAPSLILTSMSRRVPLSRPGISALRRASSLNLGHSVRKHGVAFFIGGSGTLGCMAQFNAR